MSELRKTPRWTRIPTEAPRFWELVVSVTINMLLFDLLFFVIHLSLHKSARLFRSVHWG
jgi:hypothetical protein